MMFNYLINDYPNSVFINDKEYKINSDFKTMLKIIDIIEDELFTENEKIANCIYLFYVSESIDLNLMHLAYAEIIKFMGCYQEDKKTNKNNKKTIDYSADSSFIFSAFIQLYHIDLSEVDLHWFKFKALLNSINEGKPFLVEIMQCRSVVISESMSLEQKKYYKQMKKDFAIENEEATSSFANSFLNLAKGGG